MDQSHKWTEALALGVYSSGMCAFTVEIFLI